MNLQERKPKRILKDLVIEEVSLVGRAANEGARVLFHKAAILGELKRERKDMETIEQITAAAREGHFADKAKAWESVEKILRSEVSKSDSGMGFNQSLLLAMAKPSWNAFYEAYSTLPEAERKVEKEEKRPVGKAMAEINRRAEKMLKEGVVSTFEKGVVRVCESHPELEEQHRLETR